MFTNLKELTEYYQGWEMKNFDSIHTMFFRKNKILHVVQFCELNAWKKQTWLDRFGDLQEREVQIVDKDYPADKCVTCGNKITPYEEIYCNTRETNQEVNIDVYGQFSHICKDCAAKHQEHKAHFFPEIINRYSRYERNQEIVVEEFDDGSVVEGIVPSMNDNWCGKEN